MMPEIKSLLVPLDFSSNSAHALDYARAMAIRFSASIHLVHVCEVPAMATASMDGFAIAYTDWSRQLGEEAGKELANAARELVGIRVTTEVLFGNPARAIVSDATSRGADLIVMGTHGRGAIMHMLMGNVAERVVRSAPCPVLTVGEPHAKQEVAETAPAKRVAVAAAALLAALCSRRWRYRPPRKTPPHSPESKCASASPDARPSAPIARPAMAPMGAAMARWQRR